MILIKILLDIKEKNLFRIYWKKKEEEKRNDLYDFDMELSEKLNNFRKRFINKDICIK